MAKRTSGLGRGLGDLLADNAPELRGGATVIRRDDSGEVTVTPQASDATEKIGDMIAVEKSDAGEATEISEIITMMPAEIENMAEKSEKETEIAVNAPNAIENAEIVHNPHKSLKALFRSYK